MDIFQNSEKLLLKISKDLSLKPDHFYPLSVAYIWPTKYCPVGCAHCMFASPKPRFINQNMILSEKAINNFIKMSYDAQLSYLVVSGGGEPMLELSTILKLIKEARFNYFELITGGYWTSNIHQIKRCLTKIQKAIFFKKAKQKKFSFSLRISVDRYHQKIISPKSIAHLVRIIRSDSMLPDKQRSYPDIKIYFRSLLINDDTVSKLAKLLGARLSPLKNYIRNIIFDNSSKGLNEITVFYKSMYFVGRATNLSAHKIIEFDDYFNSYSDFNDDIRLGRTYLGPMSTGALLKGLNVTVTYNGKIMPYGGVSNIYGDICKDNYKDFLNKIFHDIISRTLLLKGINYVKKFAEEVEPKLDKKIKKKNWFASIADESLSTSEIKLYVCLRLVQEDVIKGKIKVKNLPNYLIKLISHKKTSLQTEYYKYINKLKIIKRIYPNEMVQIKIKNTSIY